MVGSSTLLKPARLVGRGTGTVQRLKREIVLGRSLQRTLLNTTITTQQERADMQAGFIGLGTMGGGMAANLQKAGYKLVRLHDRFLQNEQVRLSELCFKAWAQGHAACHRA